MRTLAQAVGFYNDSGPFGPYYEFQVPVRFIPVAFFPAYDALTDQSPFFTQSLAGMITSFNTGQASVPYSAMSGGNAMRGGFMFLNSSDSSCNPSCPQLFDSSLVSISLSEADFFTMPADTYRLIFILEDPASQSFFSSLIGDNSTSMSLVYYTY